jgi:hypothetical protein
VTTQDLESYTVTQVAFSPTVISFHPDRENTVLGYGYDGSSTEALYYSTDYGHTWYKLRDNVKQFKWYATYIIFSLTEYFVNCGKCSEILDI